MKILPYNHLSMISTEYKLLRKSKWRHKRLWKSSR